MQTAETAAKASKPVGAVVQAIRLLRVLSGSQQSMGVTAVARLADVNPSTAYNMLRTLTAERLVSFDPETKKYAMGDGLIELTRGMLDAAVIDRLKRELNDLAVQSGCLTALWQIDDERVMLVHRVLANTPLRLDMEVTQRMPLLLGAVGRAAVAAMNLSDAEIKTRLKGLRWQGKVTQESYLSQVRSARKLGYAVDRELLYKGIVAIGSTISDRFGRVAYGISAIDFSEQLDDEAVRRVGTELVRISKGFLNQD